MHRRIDWNCSASIQQQLDEHDRQDVDDHTLRQLVAEFGTVPKTRLLDLLERDANEHPKVAEDLLRLRAELQVLTEAEVDDLLHRVQGKETI